MKKMWMAGLVAVLLISAFGSGAVFAQAPDDDPLPPQAAGCEGNCSSPMGRWNTAVNGTRQALGRMGRPDADGRGLMHDGLLTFAANKLGLSVADLEARLDAGETMAQIAQAEGVADWAAFMVEARETVRARMVKDGIELPGWARREGALRGNFDPERCGSGQFVGQEGGAVRRGGRGGK